MPLTLVIVKLEQFLTGNIAALFNNVGQSFTFKTDIVLNTFFSLEGEADGSTFNFYVFK